MYDIVIVGAGTAGLSAAIYGVRAGKTVLVLEAELYGGQIINTPEIVNYPGIKKTSGYEYATNLFEQAQELGAEIKFEKVIEIQGSPKERIVVTETGEYPCRAVILATGAKNRMLGIDREEELLGKGISYCATCDGGFYKGRIVGVNGGGNTALEDALYLTAYCTKVYIIHRRAEFRGEQKLLENLKKKENVEFVLDSVITSLNGEAVLESITVQNTKNQETREIPINGLFVAIGQEPQNVPFARLIKLDAKGYIAAGEDCRTSEDGIFVAGDTRTKVVRQLATAASDGAVAALAACEYLE